MPRSLNNTDTDLTADNLLRLPAEFGCPVWVYESVRRGALCPEGMFEHSYSASDARAGREGGLGIVR